MLTSESALAHQDKDVHEGSEGGLEITTFRKTRRELLKSKMKE